MDDRKLYDDLWNIVRMFTTSDRNATRVTHMIQRSYWWVFDRQIQSLNDILDLDWKYFGHSPGQKTKANMTFMKVQIYLQKKKREGEKKL